MGSLHTPNRIDLGFDPIVDYVFPDYVRVSTDRNGNEVARPPVPWSEKLALPTQVVACDSEDDDDIEVIHKQMTSKRPLGRFPLPNRDGLLALTKEQAMSGLNGRPLPRPGHAYGLGSNGALLVHLPPEHSCNGMYFGVYTSGLNEEVAREQAERFGLDPGEFLEFARMSRSEQLRKITGILRREDACNPGGRRSRPIARRRMRRG